MSSATSLPSVCLIGAGSSGIAAAKALHEHGVPFDCFEASDRVGGNWVFGNNNGMSAAYRDLHINTSRERMEYSDFPMPVATPTSRTTRRSPRTSTTYVDHFGFRDHIHFETRVEQRRRGGDGVCTVTTDDGEAREYDVVLVANGHHWDPRWPEPAFPGADSFEGEQIHAHDYIEPSIFAGKNVVVLGMGNTAMDIAVESSYVAGNTFLAARRGAWIIPKYLFGRPTDQLRTTRGSRSRSARRPSSSSSSSTSATSPNYGLPKPDHQFGEAHPTISGRILDRIPHGRVAPKPNIERLDGDHVEFADGTREQADVVVYCTGYKITFPFFDEDFISAPDNHIELFRRVFHPSYDDLFFVGLLQPLGAIMPLAEAQGAVARRLPARALRAAGAERADGRHRATTSRRCTSATSPPSATRSRSTSTTTSGGWTRSASRAPSARAARGFALPVPHRARTRRAPPTPAVAA